MQLHEGGVSALRKLKVYLDTSIVSYLDQQDAPDKMNETLRLWELFRQEKFDVYISDVVIREINQCPPEKLTVLQRFLDEISYTVIETDESTLELAEKFIDFGILRQTSLDDCQHIAAAIISGCDIITSWNFKHIVNVKTVRGVKTITTLEGYKDLLIYPPSILIESEDEENG